MNVREWQRICQIHTALFTLVIAHLVVAGTAFADEDTRKEWHYQSPNGLRRVVDQGDGKWLLHFPNGTTTDFEELERTKEYIQLRNLKNKNVQRLFADRGMSQKGGKGLFRKFADGKWVTPAPNPSAGSAKSDYRIKLAYFVPTDRTPLPDYAQRIQAVMQLVAEIFTADLRSKGYETEGPQFETKNGQMVVHLIKGDKTAREYNGLPVEKAPQHPGLVAEAVHAQLGPQKSCAVVIFAETFEIGPSRKMFPGHVANAVASPPNGGRAVCSAWMLRDEFCSADPKRLRQLFFDATPVPGRTAYDHQGPNSPRFEFMEDGIGSVLHELGHIFGPTHHQSAPSNIMGGGFRNIRWNVGLKRNSRQQAGFSKEHGWLLMTSRFLNAKVDRTDNVPPTATMQLKLQGRSVMATIEAADDKELAYISLVNVQKAKGRLLLDAKKLSGKTQTVRFRIDAREFTDRSTEILMMVVDGGGNHRQIKRKLSEISR